LLDYQEVKMANQLIVRSEEAASNEKMHKGFVSMYSPYHINEVSAVYGSSAATFVSHVSSIARDGRTIESLTESMRSNMNNVELIRKIMIKSGIIDEEGNVIPREMAGQR
jgi:hypothetical protein